MRQVGSRILFKMFCNTKLKRIMLPAVWAEATIKQMLNLKESDLNYPLIDHIRSMNLPEALDNELKSRYHYTQEQMVQGKRQFMEIFNPFGGAQIPLLMISSQLRFKQSAHNGKMSFYPNSIVTLEIFKALNDSFQPSLQSKSIVFGRPGISKSVAFLLYWHLSFLNANFRYNFQKEAKDLIDKKLLDKIMYKLLYINFNSENMDKEYIIELFLSQCPQIVDELNQSINLATNLRHLFKHIRDIYKKKQIECFLVADQLNAVARSFKQYNENERKIQQNLTADFIKGSIEYNDLKQKVRQLNLLHYDIRNSIPRIYNSSSNIQRELLGENNIRTNIHYSLNLMYHTSPPIIPVGFKKSPTKTQAKQILRFIWYCVAQRFPAQLNSKQKQQIFTQVCDEIAEEQGLNSFVTPLSIFNSIKDITQIPELDSKENIGQFVKEIYQNLYSNGFENLKKKSLKFLNDSNINSRYQKARILLECISYFQEKQSGARLPKKLVVKDSKLQIEQHIDKDIFLLQNNYIYLAIQKSQFILLAKHLKNFILSDPALFQTYQNYIRTHPGIAFEQSIISLLKSSSPCIIYFGNQVYVCNQVKYFPHMLYKTPNILISLVKLFKDIKKTKQIRQGIIALPQITQNKTKQTRQEITGLPENAYKKNSPNNPTFDIMYLKENNQHKIEITTFDLVISDQKSYFQGKLKKAVQLFQVLDQDFYFARSNLPAQKFASEVLDALKKQGKDSFLQNYNNIGKAATGQVNALKSELKEFAKEIINSESPQSFKKKIVDFFKTKKLVQQTKQHFSDLVSWNHIIVCSKAYFGDIELTVPKERVTKGEVKIKLKLEVLPIENFRVDLIGRKLTQASLQNIKAVNFALTIKK